MPTNERLINDVAVGIVLVDGTGDFELSADEETNIVAEVQEGLSWLGNNEPDAKVTWVWDVRKATVTMTPWQGARWPGMPESFYKGIDAAFVREDNGKLYMFKGDQYVRFSSVAGVSTPGTRSRSPATGPACPRRSSRESTRPSGGSPTTHLHVQGQPVRPHHERRGWSRSGYPKPIAGNWPGLPADFQTGSTPR